MSAARQGPLSSPKRPRFGDPVELGRERGVVAYLVLAPERTVGVRLGERLVQVAPAAWAAARFDATRRAWVVPPSVPA